MAGTASGGSSGIYVDGLLTKLGIADQVKPKAKLKKGGHVTVVGFGSFHAVQRAARTGRNPRTGAHVSVDQKSVPFFKTGKEMRERLNKTGTP